MPAHWLTVVAWGCVALGFTSAGWMAQTSFVLSPTPHRLHPDSAAYWFLMQVGMGLGFVTAMPVNGWLLRRGIEETM